MVRRDDCVDGNGGLKLVGVYGSDVSERISAHGCHADSRQARTVHELVRLTSSTALLFRRTEAVASSQVPKLIKRLASGVELEI